MRSAPYDAKQDHSGAIRSWERLLALPLAAADAKAVTERLAQARQALAVDPARRSGMTPPGATAGAVASRISGTVLLGDGVRNTGPIRGALFVIARKGGGPPLAVKRITDPTFPLPFALGPEDVMHQGSELRGEVTLIARLKRDGRPGPAITGDLEGVAAGKSVAVGTTDVRITMNPVRDSPALERAGERGSPR